MRAASERVGRLLTLLASLLFLGPPAAVALTGLGAPPWLAVVVPAAVAVVLGTGYRRVPAMPLGLARQHPVTAALWVLVFCAAVVQVTRASVFAYDVNRREWSATPADRFRSEHYCFTAYVEAARFAAEDDVNVYDSQLYRPGGTPRRIGPLTVDPFHYPPPFLLTAAAVRLSTVDFGDARRLWFGLQVLLLAGVMLGWARWVGGDAGRRLALATVVFWIAPTTWLALQTGNFQITAMPLAMLGAMLAWSTGAWSGTTLLTYAAAAKVFPALLVLHLIAAERWRAFRRVAVAALAIAGLTALAFGIDPFIHFVRDELPRIASGASFPQTENPAYVQVNQSFYGMTVKLRFLGLSWLDQPTGRQMAQIYAGLVATLAIVTGLRMGRPGTIAPGNARLTHAARWLAILNLASFASPFVGGTYGAVGTMWLMVALAAGARTPFRRWIWFAALVPAGAVPWLVPSPRSVPVASDAWLMTSILWQVGTIALNTWAAWPRPSSAPSASIRTEVPAPA